MSLFDAYDPWLLGLLVVSGIASGFVNTLAGGGSLMTLPALMLLGLPADLANGSNRLSVVAQSVSGVVGFHRKGKLDTSAMGGVLLPTLIGSAIGAFIASRAPVELLEPALLATMVIVALLMAFKPSAVTGGDDEVAQSVDVKAWAGLFAAGLYGGFIQAGVGFVLLSVLGGLLRYDLVRANALKLVCTTIFGIVALAIFVQAGQVVWLPAAVLAVATVTGSQAGVRFALKVRPAVIRKIVLVCVVASVLAVLLKG
jgi:uncharacterized membrane protein YfcA